MQPLVKYLVIGGDAIDPNHVEKYIQMGDMPNMDALRKRGLWGRSLNPPALEAGTAWPSFHTGLLPGNQPQFDALRHLDTETYGERWYSEDEVEPNIWEHLSKQGKRCLVIETPYVRMYNEINGAMILDWAPHVPHDGGNFRFHTQPPELADEILKEIGQPMYAGRMCDGLPRESFEDHKKILDNYIDSMRRRAKLTVHMLKKGNWDYAEIIFTELHCIGHQLWHISDKDHPKHDPKLAAFMGDPIRQSYQVFDEALGEILKVVDETQTTFMFYGSHGMGPQYSGTGLLDRILFQIEAGKPAKSQRPLKASLLRAWQSLPGGLRAQLRPLRKGLRGSLKSPRFLPNPEKRKFFEMYANNATGGVRVNLKGRESQGIVEEADYMPLLKRVEDELSKVMNKETGEPLIRDMVITRERYSGPHVDRLPDLLVNWNRNAPIRVVQSAMIGSLSQEYGGYRTGDHTPEGGFCVVGPGISHTILNEMASPVDFLPTVSAFFGLDMPKTDGTPIRQVSDTGAGRA